MSFTGKKNDRRERLEMELADGDRRAKEEIREGVGAVDKPAPQFNRCPTCDCRHDPARPDWRFYPAREHQGDEGPEEQSIELCWKGKLITFRGFGSASEALDFIAKFPEAGQGTTGREVKP